MNLERGLARYVWIQTLLRRRAPVRRFQVYRGGGPGPAQDARGWNDVPQPQEDSTFGFSIWKPVPRSPST